ncbi:ParM/StbA family protein [Orenia marismortui]|uniref:ParM/StbA family protein n=1 Tax=Orenia marismortui TaxID=46469 RepID=UPI00039FF301|nr:ParM/StbA family protein [Orenia marismortui]
MKISIDFGHHSIKGINEKGEEVYFQSVVSEDMEQVDLSLNLGIVDEDYIKVKTDGSEYLIGQLALDEGDIVIHNNFEEDFASLETEVLIKTAIAKLFTPEEDWEQEVELLVTIPVNQYYRHAKDFARIFEDKNINIELFDFKTNKYVSKKFKISTVDVKPQGFTALLDFALTENGQIDEVRKRFVGGNVVVIDVGFFSVDLYQTKALKPVKINLIKAIDGMHYAYTQLAKVIANKFNIVKEPYEVEEYFRIKKVNGVSIESDINKILDKLTRHIVSQIRTTLPDYKEVDNFLLTGGGSYHLAEHIGEKITNLEVQEEALLANARGGLKWLRRQAK